MQVYFNKAVLQQDDSRRRKVRRKWKLPYVELPVETLSRLVDYNPVTGLFVYKNCTPDLMAGEDRAKVRNSKRWNTMFDGKSAFTTKSTRDYLCGVVLGQAYRAHRVAWALHYGEWPSHHIDHINGDKKDNRIVNLRVVSEAESQRNRPLQANNKSGVPGVRWNKRYQNWHVKIGIDNRDIHLGCFDDKAMAIAARKAAESQYGFHQNHGRPQPETRRN